MFDAHVIDRAEGALIGAAVGDALGAGYEFEWHENLKNVTPVMKEGTFGTAPGEWTDDMSMTWCIADAAAHHADLASTAGLDAVAANFHDWFLSHPPDIGNQIRNVLAGASLVKKGEYPTAAEMTSRAMEVYRHNPDRSAGNGSLMRTAPVALAYLTKPDEELVAAAMAISDLTHGDPLCGEACAIWCLAIKWAIFNGDIPNLHEIATKLPDADRVAFWQDQIADAEQCEPEEFAPNGFVLAAFKAAWSTIHHTGGVPNEEEEWFREVLYRVIRVGHDTDTTASIAGALAGAIVGRNEIPYEWHSAIHGYHDADAAKLNELTGKILAHQPKAQNHARSEKC